MKNKHESYTYKVPEGVRESISKQAKPRGRALPQLRIHESSSSHRRPPDSWYAFSSSSLGYLLSSQPAHTNRNAESVREAIIDVDDRQQIKNKHAEPYSWVCDLSIKDATGNTWSGTGWLCAPGLVITAGHCVYIPNHGGWAQSIKISINSNNNKSTVIRSESFHSVDGWINGQEEECDYGAITLPSEHRNTTGFFGYAVLSDSAIDGETVNLVGYPTDKPEGSLWGKVTNLQRNMPNTLIYNHDTYFGMSGSPVIMWDSADYRVVGIHNTGDITGNRATRITNAVFDNIQAWSSQN